MTDNTKLIEICIDQALTHLTYRNNDLHDKRIELKRLCDQEKDPDKNKGLVRDLRIIDAKIEVFDEAMLPFRKIYEAIR